MPEPDESALPVLDEQVLGDLSAAVGGDRSFVVDLIDAYLADGAVQLGAIEAAVATGDGAALVRPAHTLKSSSATLGAQRLAAGSRRLEMAGRSGSLGEEARAEVNALRDEWEAATAALRAWVAAGGPS